jgi:PKD repeat protein
MSRLQERLWAARPALQENERGRASGRRRTLTALAVLGLSVGMAANTGSVAGALGFAPRAVGAVPVVASSTQFDITGVIQAARLDTPGDVHSGGTIVVNGHTVVIPQETVVILPANALTWQEMFTHAPAPYGPGQSGLALTDTPKPLTTYEAHLVGNRVINASGDRYIAGLVNITQEDLNTGAGYINFINYTTGELEVGGSPGVPNTGARVQINDPANSTSGSGGRYGRATSPDDRFQVDQDNPTIEAETGFPMCIPRTDPTVAGGDDALCPQADRPVVAPGAPDQSGITPNPNALVAGENYRVFRMDTPAQVDSGVGCLRTLCADPRKQAPFEIGDYVTFAGTLIQDGGANGGQYVSAHTITASLGIYTQPGVDPAYVSIEVALIGTGGLTVFGAGEAAVRTRFEGMTTDETRKIRLYGVDINPTTGATTDRDWGSVLPDLGPPTGAVRGRWRFRPPCTGTAATVSVKICTPPPAGQFIPPTREVRAVIDKLQQFNVGGITPNPASQIPVPLTPPATPPACSFANGSPVATNSPCTTANGIFFGQYHAPIGEYIFPENVPGTAVPENNFNTMPFLAYGGYQSITGTQVGRLNPWPSNVTPPPVVCASPTINGAPYSVANGGSIPLSGSVTAGATSPVTLEWTAGTGLFGTATGTDLNSKLTGAATSTPTFNATGLAAGTYNVNLTVSNVCGVATASTTITVQAAPAPTINPIQDQTVTAGATVNITASSASAPAPRWTWTSTGAPAGIAPPVAFNQNPAAATPAASSTLTFTTSAASPGTYTFTVTATNANGTSSPTTVRVTTTASVPVNVVLTPVEYRTSKQRLVITSVAPAAAGVTSMVLQPYLTETGTVFDPATLGANLTVSLVAPGSFTITLVGAPPPACRLGGTYATPCTQTPITVKSVNAAGAVIGTSAPTALDKIRQ